VAGLSCIQIPLKAASGLTSGIELPRLALNFPAELRLDRLGWDRVPTAFLLVRRP
jgi:hypothetical protein